MALFITSKFFDVADSVTSKKLIITFFDALIFALFWHIYSNVKKLMSFFVVGVRRQVGHIVDNVARCTINLGCWCPENEGLW